MAELVKCIECKKKVSSLAKECPSCHKDPKAVICKFCGRRIKASTERTHAEQCVQTFIMKHHDLQEFSCPVCHEVISYSSNTPTCPKCGHPFLITPCVFCNQPVEKENAIKRSLQVSLHPSCCSVMDAGSTREGACFIATTIYGSPYAPNVMLLKRFRNDVLMHSNAGIQLVNWYYAVSPPIAHFLSYHSLVRTMVKYICIEPVIWLLSVQEEYRAFQKE